MLSTVLFFAGAFAMAVVICETFLMVLAFVSESATVRLLIANGAALIVCELLYRTIDARFFVSGSAAINAAAQLACLGSEWLLMARAQEKP